MRKLLTVLLLALVTAGCGVLYRQPIHQGNLIDPQAASQLQVGMHKQQVLGLLGTPSIRDAFHQSRWDYTATRLTGRVGATQIKNLTLWFENDALARWEGEYFPQDDKALAEEMRKFGNLPREKNRR
ncbi:MAG: outer membrane protein assembly factor BamE [Pseudoxanthomonas suwonensis]|nr:outer membrane protein assembly factor BamE [Pseudoxanthomonas suwonensis]